MRGGCPLDLPVEPVRRLRAAGVDVGQSRRLGYPDQVPVALIQARVYRQQLVHRRERAEQPRQVHHRDGTELFAHPVDQEIQRVQRPPVRGAEGDQLAGVPPAVQALQEIPGHQAAHRMPDQDQLGIGRLQPPLVQPPAGLLLQPPRRDPVIPPPVIREREEIPARREGELALQVRRQLGIPVDLPQPRDQVQIRDHHRRGDPVVGVPVPQLKISQIPSQCHQRPRRRSRSRRPYIPAPAISQHTAGDARQHHHHIRHRTHPGPPTPKSKGVSHPRGMASRGNP